MLAPRACLVIHTNGFHPVTLQFCQCDNAHLAGDVIEQLLRAELFGATIADPTTFCTFRVLELFQVLTLQSKVPATDFYETLAHLTDNLSVTPRYVSLGPYTNIRLFSYICTATA